MKNILLLISLLSITFSNGQSSEEIAKAYYFKAEAEYEDGNDQKVIEYLLKAEELIGRTNGSIEALKAKSYFELEKFEVANDALSKYFDFSDTAPEKLKREMAELFIKLKEKQNAIDGEINRNRIKKLSTFYNSNLAIVSEEEAIYYRPPAKKVSENLYEVVLKFAENDSVYRQTYSIEEPVLNERFREVKTVQIFRKNGKKRSEINLLNNEIKTYYSNGQLKHRFIGYQEDNRVKDLLEVYNLNGEKLEQFSLKNGNGYIMVFADNNIDIIGKVFFVNGYGKNSYFYDSDEVLTIYDDQNEFKKITNVRSIDYDENGLKTVTASTANGNFYDVYFDEEGNYMKEVKNFNYGKIRKIEYYYNKYGDLIELKRYKKNGKLKESITSGFQSNSGNPNYSRN